MEGVVETQTGRVELAYAVFDKTNGTIVHFHRHIIVSLAVRASNAADDKAAALRHAVKASGRKAEELGVLPVDREIRRGYRYAVDVAKMALRETAV
jgi:hypothetical protein